MSSLIHIYIQNRGDVPQMSVDTGEGKRKRCSKINFAPQLKRTNNAHSSRGSDFLVFSDACCNSIFPRAWFIASTHDRHDRPLSVSCLKFHLIVFFFFVERIRHRYTDCVHFIGELKWKGACYAHNSVILAPRFPCKEICPKVKPILIKRSCKLYKANSTFSRVYALRWHI